MNDDFTGWAEETFGGAELGDPRRTRRVVAMAEQAARTPAGRVTEVFESSADREGAFRFLENPAVSAERVSESAFSATAQQCAAQNLIYVAIDSTSLTLTDRKKRRELGRVGKRWPTRGLHVMTALGVDHLGAAVGILAQNWWAQDKPRNRKHMKCFGNRYLERETRYWIDSIQDVSRRLEKQAPSIDAWYQLDRGADCWPVLAYAVEHQLRLTVRSCHNRRLEDHAGRRVYLREKLKKQRVLGHYEIDLPARANRPARRAKVALRACPVVLLARVGSKKWMRISLHAVRASEVNSQRKDKLCWILLTTARVETFDQARAVVHGYTLRWRVEEFHRTWKRGLCRVEDTQLQSRSAIVKWATILATVAARALRIAQLLRTNPDIPATQEFTAYEIAATFALAKRKLDRRRTLSLEEVVDMIAELGGFANKYSGGRPGPTVLGRGLQKIAVIALALKNIDDLR